MKKIAPASFVPSAVLFAAVFAYFAFFYPFHVSFKEQFQLFEFTSGYALETLLMPGGLADLLGRFLVQFFILAPVGALILAAVVTGIQWLGARFVGQWSTLPAICIWVFLADYISVLTAAVGLLIVLGTASTLKTDKVPGRVAVSAALYLLTGPVAVLYAFLPAPRSGKAAAGSLACTACTAALALLSQFVFKREAWRFFAGVEYLRAPHLMPVLLWLAAAVLLLIVLQYIPRFKSPVPAYILGIAAAVASLWFTYDGTQETLMKYDRLAAQGKWDRILSEAGRDKKFYPRTCAAINLALSQKGQLCERMFEFPQSDASGLLPDQGKDCFQPLLVGEIYFHMGLESQARRCYFEAQESIPNMQKSARCTKRLAQICLLMGHDDAAQHYIEKLNHTLFHSGKKLLKWKESEEFALLQSRMPRNFDGYYNFVNPERHWLAIAYETGNPVISEYLMARAMLTRNAKGIGSYLATLKPEKLPRHLEEAVLAIQNNYPELVDGISVSSRTIDNYMKFLQSGKAPAGSYWKYLYATVK